MLAPPSDAGQIRIRITNPFVYIQIGHGDLSNRGLLGGPASLVDEVSFAIPAGVQPGDGTPVVGTPVIPMAVVGLNAGTRIIFRVTIDSSAPLLSGNGDQLPFSEFSWTSRDGDIPGGQFSNSPNQLLLDYNARRRGRGGRGVVDQLTFSYANDKVFVAGSYTGRIVYTITEL